MTSVVYVDTDATIVVEQPEIEVLTLEGDEILIIQEEDARIVAVGEQGPPGPAGDMALYARRTDIASNEIIFKGIATPGSKDEDPVWAISKIEIDGSLVKETWAGGDKLFSHAWIDRSQLSYS